MSAENTPKDKWFVDKNGNPIFRTGHREYKHVYYPDAFYEERVDEYMEPAPSIEDLAAIFENGEMLRPAQIKEITPEVSRQFMDWIVARTRENYMGDFEYVFPEPQLTSKHTVFEHMRRAAVLGQPEEVVRIHASGVSIAPHYPHLPVELALLLAGAYKVRGKRAEVSAQFVSTREEMIYLERLMTADPNRASILEGIAYELPDAIVSHGRKVKLDNQLLDGSY